MANVPKPILSPTRAKPMAVGWNRARRHAKTNPGDIKGPSQYKPLHSQRQFCHIDRSLLARRRATFGTSTATFGMATGRYYFIPSNTTLKRISPIFPCSLLSLLLPKEFETFSLFQYQSTEESCFGIAQVTLGTSTGHFWHVDGPLLFYYLLFSSPQPV